MWTNQGRGHAEKGPPRAHSPIPSLFLIVVCETGLCLSGTTGHDVVATAGHAPRCLSLLPGDPSRKRSKAQESRWEAGFTVEGLGGSPGGARQPPRGGPEGVTRGDLDVGTASDLFGWCVPSARAHKVTQTSVTPSPGRAFREPAAEL